MIKHYLMVLLRYFRLIGLDPIKSVLFLRGLPRFIADYVRVRRRISRGEGEFPLGALYPCVQDRYQSSGSASGHYFHQDLLVAQSIYESQPKRHIDIGSRIDGFVAHVAAFRPIEVFDIRHLESNSENIKYRQLDLMGSLPAEFSECTDSLSCLHALEHFGLGRYGDPLDLAGYAKGFDNLVRILAPGGKLYLSVPIGPQRIEFNAHRVFSVSYLLEMFSEQFRVDRFSFVDDSGDLHKDCALSEQSTLTNYGCKYGCGIFELTKKVNDSDE